MVENLIAVDFPFASKFIEVHGSPIHYIDEGSGDPILFLHGNPTSCYLWRNVIPHLLPPKSQPEAPLDSRPNSPRGTPLGRCVAPDLIGMGKSGKPDVEYRFFDHVRYLEGFIEQLGLKNITFVIHDWGSALGFHYAMRHEGNVKALAFMEAILLPTPSWEDFPAAFRDIFKAFRSPDVGWELIVTKNMFIEKVLPGGMMRELSEAEMTAYRAPYHDPASRTPLWRWPNELPIAGEPADVVEVVSAYNAWLRQSELPKLLFHATPGALVTEQVAQWCRQRLKNLTMVHLGDATHYVQEDHPHLIGAELAAWLGALP